MGNKQGYHNLPRTPLLEVKDFSLTFRQYERGLRETEQKVIHRLNVTIFPGEIIAVVGASGSGKSLLADAILGILPSNAMTSGVLNYKGDPLTNRRQKALRGKEISLIPQSVNALDPLMKTGRQVYPKDRKRNKQQGKSSVFQKVGLSKKTHRLYPFELSGGMARRVLVSMAMVSGADLIIADEPTPGIDPASLKETLKQMKLLVDEDKGMMFITHDINVALELADKIVVFHAGETVDVADVGDFTGEGERLKHPYTKELWNALPQTTFSINRDIKYNGPVQKGMKKIRTNNKLEIRDVGYHYPGQEWLFSKLGFTIHPGEIVGVFGYSGAGKSTMAQIISGYKTAQHGKVLIDGYPASPKESNPVQLVWQHPEKAINPKWRIKRIMQEVGTLDEGLLDLFGIRPEWFKRWPSELSGGELQRICIVRALSGDNLKYLIADEMTTMLDAITQAHIWHALHYIATTQGIGVLAISHDHSLLKRISDRVINFSDLTKVRDDIGSNRQG